MKKDKKKYLLIMAASALVLSGCDSVVEPVVEEVAVEEIIGADVVEENTEKEVETTVEETIEAKPVEEEAVVEETSTEEVTALPIETEEEVVAEESTETEDDIVVEEESISTEEQLINAEKVAALPVETVKIFEQIAVAYQNGDYIGACNFAKQLGIIGEATDRSTALSELFNQLYAAGFKLTEEPALIGTINGIVGIHKNMNKYTMLYCGDYKEGKREGKGILICLWIDYPYYAVGEWKDDMPNGKQDVYMEGENRWIHSDNQETVSMKVTKCSGNVINGLWNGEINYNSTDYVEEQVFAYQIYTANFENGKIKVFEQRDYDNVIAYGSAYDSYENKKSDSVKFRENKDSSDKLYGCLWGYGDTPNLPASWGFSD